MMKHALLTPLAVAAAILVSPLLQADEISESPVQREANKDSVIKKLTTLFQRNQIPDQGEPLPPTKPYIKIVEGKDGRSTIVYRCQNAKAKGLVDPMESVISSSGTVEYVEEKNMMVINDKQEKVDELQSALATLDIDVPQVLVEAQIIEVFWETGEERDIQIQYTKRDNDDDLTSTIGYALNAPSDNRLPDQGAGFNFYPYSSGTTIDRIQKNLNLFVRWLKSARDAKILSAPNLIVDLGTTANMVTGEDIPIQETQVTGDTVTSSTYFKRVGVKLNVTPVIINDQTVRLQVNPEVTATVRFVQFEQNGNEISTPVIAIRNINTELTVSDGEIIMLGGLYSSEKNRSTRKTPFLSDIPIIGELFTAVDDSEIQKQLVFFLKVHILDKTRPNGLILQDVEQTAEEVETIGEILKDSKTLFPDEDEKKRREAVKKQQTEEQ